MKIKYESGSDVQDVFWRGEKQIRFLRGVAKEVSDDIATALLNDSSKKWIKVEEDK